LGASDADIAKGLRLVEAQERGQETRRQKWEPTKREWRRVMNLVLSEHVGRAQRMRPTHLTRLVARRIHPELSAIEIEKLVASRKCWIKDFLSEDCKEKRTLG